MLKASINTDSHTSAHGKYEHFFYCLPEAMYKMGNTNSPPIIFKSNVQNSTLLQECPLQQPSIMHIHILQTHAKTSVMSF